MLASALHSADCPRVLSLSHYLGTASRSPRLKQGQRFLDRRQGVAVLDDTLLESVRAVLQAVNFVCTPSGHCRITRIDRGAACA